MPESRIFLRFHWEFLGPDARPTAEHFCKHLEEFCEREAVSVRRTWVTALPVKCIATLECGEEHLKLVRDRLRPKRAERVG